ncbi:MAG: glycosyltransferase family 2 protein [Caldiserica bacterium]|nr:glycosyltransferase family 2 protein [Caldisericota bacterium]
MKISLVIPAFNEEGNITPLYQKIKEVLENRHDWELIFVNDGSRDRTREEIEEIAGTDERVKAVHLPTNFGKTIALKEGFKKATGEVIFTLDADLQDDPEEIEKFLQKIEEGHDVVCGWRFHRRDPLWKRVPSRIFNFFVSLLGGVKLHDINCGYKAFRKEVIEKLDFYGDLYRFIPLIAHSKGFRVTEVKVKHAPRKRGKSKYGWKKFYWGFLDFITIIFLTHYRVKPLHLFGTMGTVLFLPGAAIEIGLAVLWFTSSPHSIGGHYPLLWLGILLLIVGIQLISLGLLGEMIVYGFMSMKKE